MAVPMRITVNGISLFYEVRGKGPAMVLLHGNGEDHRIFSRAADYLGQKFTLYMIDSRGHGESSPVSEYHYEDMADDLAEFIRKLKLDRPIVLGFSDGGIVGLIYASEHPEGLSHLFACGANTRPEALKGLSMALLRMKRHPDAKERMMLSEPHLTDEMLSSITAPVTVVAGSRDCVDRKDTYRIASAVQDGKAVIMSRADHSSYIVGSTRIVDVVFTELGIDISDVQVVFGRRRGFSATPRFAFYTFSGIAER